MAVLNERRCRLTVAVPVPLDYKTISLQSTEIEGFRTRFDVEKSLGKHPNDAKFTITNLSAASRSVLQHQDAKVIFEGGYAETFAQIFQGDARITNHVLKGSDWETTIECGDGRRAFKFARVNQAFKEGTGAGDVLAYLIKAMGLNPGNSSGAVAELNTSLQYRNGYSAFGLASREISRVLEAVGWSWSIQSGAIQILKPGGTLSDVVVISPSSGLVGSPEMGSADKQKKSPILKVKALLQPSIYPGGRVVVESASHSGVFRVLKVHHTGDTAGGEWYTDLELEPSSDRVAATLAENQFKG